MIEKKGLKKVGGLWFKYEGDEVRLFIKLKGKKFYNGYKNLGKVPGDKRPDYDLYIGKERKIRVGGVWEKKENGKTRYFIKINAAYFNCYENDYKQDTQPDYNIFIGKKD